MFLFISTLTLTFSMTSRLLILQLLQRLGRRGDDDKEKSSANGVEDEDGNSHDSDEETEPQDVDEEEVLGALQVHLCFP